MRLVLVSTSGNQRYVFASNKLREAVGASRLVAMSTTAWVRGELAESDAVLQESSGTTLLQVPDEARARALAAALTRRAHSEAPGLDLSVVSVPMAGDQATREEVDAVFGESNRHRSRRASAAVRFPRLPVVASCASTDLPAMGWHSDSGPDEAGDYAAGEVPQPLSAEVIAKRRARRAAVRSVQRRLAGYGPTKGKHLVKLDDFFETVEWAAVVHADGNRLGALFQAAIEGLPLAEITQLSQAVARVAERAFCDAVVALSGLAGQAEEPRRATAGLPVVPLVIGGDDLTMLVEGKYALEMVDAYLRAFSRHASASELLSKALELDGRSALTVAAGVAVVKPHFPFSVAYDLSEELCRSAKALAAQHPGCHGLDVHVLLDSVITSLDTVRDGYRTVAVDPVVLTQRPYLVPVTGGSVPPERDWTQVLPRLRMVRQIPRGGDAAVTRTQLHELKAELRADPVRAQRRLAELGDRATANEDRDMLRAIAGDPPQMVVNGSCAVHDLIELSPFVNAPVTA